MPLKDSFDMMLDEGEGKKESTPNPGPSASKNNTNANANPDTNTNTPAELEPNSSTPDTDREPTEEQIYQTPQAGPILMPVNEVTEMMTGLERQKLTGGELRQKVVNEHISSKYWRGQALKFMEWYNNVQHKLQEAQARNQQYVSIPPLPFMPPEAHMNENKDKDTVSDDKELLREFGRVVGPYLAVGKYLKGDEDNKTSLIMQDSQGNRYEIPPQLAPYYMPFQNQSQGQQQQPSSTPESQMPSVTIEQGNNKFTIPLSYAPFFMSWISGQNPYPGQTPQNAQESPRETSLSKALADIQSEIKGLKSSASNNNQALPNTDELDRFNSLLNLIDRVEDRRYNKARPGPDEEAGDREPFDLQKHRISEEELTKREKEKTKQKQMETFHDILGSPEKDESGEREDYIRREELGRDFLNDTIRKAKEQNIMI